MQCRYLFDLTSPFKILRAIWKWVLNIFHYSTFLFKYNKQYFLTIKIITFKEHSTIEKYILH